MSWMVPRLHGSVPNVRFLSRRFLWRGGVQEAAPARNHVGLRRSCPEGSAHWERRRQTWHGCCRPPLPHEASSFSPRADAIPLSESQTGRQTWLLCHPQTKRINNIFIPKTDRLMTHAVDYEAHTLSLFLTWPCRKCAYMSRNNHWVFFFF